MGARAIFLVGPGNAAAMRTTLPPTILAVERAPAIGFGRYPSFSASCRLLKAGPWRSMTSDFDGGASSEVTFKPLTEAVMARLRTKEIGQP